MCVCVCARASMCVNVHMHVYTGLQNFVFYIQINHSNDMTKFNDV